MDANLTVNSNPTEPVKFNMGVVLLIVTVAALVGIAPAILYFRRPDLLPYFAGGAALVAFGYYLLNRFVAKLTSKATYAPGAIEFLLAGVGAVFPFALLSVIWVISYEILDGLFRLIKFVGNLTALDSDSIGSIVFIVTLVLASIGGIGFILISYERMIRQLYPDAAGIRSAFYELATIQRKRLLTYVAVSLLLMLIPPLMLYSLTVTLPQWLFGILAVYLCIITSSAFSKSALSLSAGPEAVRAIGRLLEASGYEIKILPSIGDAEVDPLLVNLDILAANGERALAVKLKTGQVSSKPIDWSVGSGLLMCVLTLNKFVPRLGLRGAQEVEPYLVLIGVKADQSLTEFAEDESVGLVLIEDETVIQQLLETEDQELLRQKAKAYFGFSVTEQQAVTLTGETSVSGGQV